MGKLARSLLLECEAAYTHSMMRFVVGLLAIISFLSPNFLAPAVATPRPGAPRPLQSEGVFIAGTHARLTGETLTFARGELNNLDWWSATPRRDTNASAKILDWVVSARALDPRDVQNVLSPDGSRLAYVSSRSGVEAIYLEPVGERMGDINIRRIAFRARNPVWMDANTLIYESTKAEQKGLYRISIPAGGGALGEPELLFSRGGEVAVSPDKKAICLAIIDEKSGGSQLFLLAPDGSGARVLPQTKGARRPSFSPDGKAIFFDAPAPVAEGSLVSASRERVIWTLPLVASPPVAQLFSAREAKNGDVEIVGTLFSSEEGNVQAQLEFSPGEGAEPVEGQPEMADASRVWFTCPLNRAPIHNGVLGSWPLPRKKAGETQAWTMRLTATDGAGERAVSTLTFMWPPDKNAGNSNITLPPFFAVNPEDYGLTIEPEAAPKIEPPKASAPPQVVPSKVVAPPVAAPKNTVPKIVPPTAAPTAAVPSKVVPPNAAPPKAAPPKVVAPPVKPAPVATSPSLPPSVPSFSSLPEPFDPAEIAPMPFPIRSDSEVEEEEESAPIPAAPLARRASAQAAPRIAKALPRAAPKPVEQKASKPAPKNNGGIPSRMKSGSTVPVTVILRNTGSRSWSSTGDSPVRLIYRWINADTNIRQRWAVHWLREEVPPGKSTQMKFDLVAPPATGRFILTYALVRLNSQIYDGKSYKPPSTKAKDHRWPGEFGAVSFNITVTP